MTHHAPLPYKTPSQGWPRYTSKGASQEAGLRPCSGTQDICQRRVLLACNDADLSRDFQHSLQDGVMEVKILVKPGWMSSFSLPLPATRYIKKRRVYVNIVVTKKAVQEAISFISLLTASSNRGEMWSFFFLADPPLINLS